MNKLMGILFILAAFLVGGANLQAEELETAAQPESTVSHNPIEQFTGKYWVNSTESNKEAYLFGIESMIAMDYFIDKHNLQGKRSKNKTATVLSPFEKGWMEAFRDTSRKQIMDDVNKWYENNPDQMDRPVMGVLWYEVIAPRLNKATN